jgi:hypothetical protein
MQTEKTDAPFQAQDQPPEKKVCTCGLCGQVGHNKRKCPVFKYEAPDSAPQPKRSKLLGVKAVEQHDGQVLHSATVKYNGGEISIGSFPTMVEAEAAYHAFWKNPAAFSETLPAMDAETAKAAAAAARSAASAAKKARAKAEASAPPIAVGRPGRAARGKAEQESRAVQKAEEQRLRYDERLSAAAAAADALAEAADAEDAAAMAALSPDAQARLLTPSAGGGSASSARGVQSGSRAAVTPIRCALGAGAEQEESEGGAAPDTPHSDAAMRERYANSSHADAMENFSTATILRNSILRLLPADAPTKASDEICAKCYELGQREEVAGEEVLSCSFCTEVYHNRAACLGEKFFPIGPYEAACIATGEDEWACPKCFLEAHGKHLRMLYPDEEQDNDEHDWSDKVIVNEIKAHDAVGRTAGPQDIDKALLPPNLYIDRVREQQAVEKVARDAAAQAQAVLQEVEAKQAAAAAELEAADRDVDGKPDDAENAEAKQVWVQCEEPGCERWHVLGRGVRKWDGAFRCGMNNWRPAPKRGSKAAAAAAKNTRASASKPKGGSSGKANNAKDACPELALGLSFTTKMRGFGLVTGRLVAEAVSPKGGWVVHFDGEEDCPYSAAKIMGWVQTATEMHMDDNAAAGKEGEKKAAAVEAAAAAAAAAAEAAEAEAEEAEAEEEEEEEAAASRCRGRACRARRLAAAAAVEEQSPAVERARAEAAQAAAAAEAVAQGPKTKVPCTSLPPLDWALVAKVLDSVEFPSQGTRKNVKISEEDEQEGFCLGAVHTRGHRGVSYSMATGQMPSLARLLVGWRVWGGGGRPPPGAPRRHGGGGGAGRACAG